MIEKRKYILETVNALPENDPLLHHFFAECLRENRVGYLRYRTEYFKWRSSQFRLFEIRASKGFPL